LPAIKDFPHKATTDAAQIKAWWDGKSSNIGISTSHYATDQALIVLDIDIKKGKRGDLSLMQLELEGFELPPTFTVLTPSGGTHLYYRTPKALRQGVDLLGSGIDVRSLGGYVIGPGSSLDDKEYVITNKTQIAPAPEWLIQRLGAARERDTTTTKTLPGIKPDRAAQRAKEWLEKYAPIATEGEGGDAETFKVSAHLKDLGCSADQALELMLSWNERCLPPWSQEELETKVRNAFKYGREPRGVAAPEAVFTAVEEPLPDEWPEPEPLAEFLPDVAPFDLELMPHSLRPLVKDVAERMQVPLDFPAVAAIATLAGVTNRRAVIQPKRNDHTWTVVPNLWGGIVAPPGMLKSPVLTCMTQPARAIESEWRKAHDFKDQVYLSELESHKLEIAAWEQEFKKAAKKKGSAERPAKPESNLAKPTLRRLVTSDATFESLHLVLSENPAGLFVIRDELTGWLAGLERQGREQERAFFLECWNGDAAFTVDRIGRGSVHVPHACISLFGGIQPARLRDYLADAMRDGPSNDGLVQRFQLMVWPDIPPAWRYVDRQPDVDALEYAAQVYRRMAALEAAEPLRLQFDDEAQALFERWLTDLEQRIRGEDAEVMQAHLSKYRSLMPSLALLFALADGHTDCVPLSQAKLACGWCEYLETHARRVYSAQARPEQHAAIALSKRLSTGWKREDGFFTVRDVYRSGWTALDSPDAARGALLVLEEYGWVRRETETHAHGRPSETYRINPRIRGHHAGK
jgi:putative DNA primase/helicase